MPYEPLTPATSAQPVLYCIVLLLCIVCVVFYCIVYLHIVCVVFYCIVYLHFSGISSTRRKWDGNEKVVVVVDGKGEDVPRKVVALHCEKQQIKRFQEPGDENDKQ